MSLGFLRSEERRVGKEWEKSECTLVSIRFSYFGFCFLIELLKKIEALLFFEIGLCL